ncbi:DUF2398 family protein [Streptomyces sp. B29(2018)]|uniref:DUF2398 family protein n=1 Tax=Streptomyces sp. B29(2018) TaxID=2485016 RepID=UPI000FD66904|nr:DUF2398 family protein [Streptomyces sp. B29(2018)]
MTLPSAHDVALATERRTAARLLLAHPLVTSDGPHADLFPLVRRHADWLGGRLQQVLGYRLLVDSSYARLFKAGLGARSGHRLVRSTGTPFTPHTYACLALALSVLVTAPEQVLLSQLVADIRAAAADADIELASVTGSAHGLDDGTWLARLVQRGITLAHDTDLPGDAVGRRALWRLVAVTPDEVSSTVLTYGLRPLGENWRARSLRERADHRAETDLTSRDLRDVPLHLPAGSVVHICENPRVVEAAADAGCSQALVCTSGSAATVVLTLLDALASGDCRFAYHGDFDWPGIALANRIMRRYGARPWRMGADDYEHLATRSQAEGIPPLPLIGKPVSAVWDAGLAPAMAALGVALHEEATLDLLVDDLGIP